VDEQTIAFCDYETFWDVGFSLRSPKISTTDYIHDARFAIHGAACAIGREEPRWLRGADLAEWMWNLPEDAIFVAHHVLFDGYITTHHIGKEFKEYFCTMGMLEALYQGAVSRGLDEAMTTLLGWDEGKTDILKRTKGRYWNAFTPAERCDMATYSRKDLRGTQQLFYTYADKLPPDEWRVMSTVLKMFCHPRLEFDEPLLQEALKDAHNDRDSRIEDALTYFGCTEKDLSGNITFIELLNSTGCVVPYKPSPSVEGKMIPAFAKTDQGFQDLLEHDDPRVVALAIGRQAVKSTQGITRAQRFLDLHESIGKLPIAYNYYRAHTGRLSGANKINATNLKQGSALRRAIVAPKDFVLAVADSSQIECRDNGYIAGQSDLMDLFREKRDPYNDMASTIFGREINRKLEADYMEGFLGKTAVLGLGFQMGGPKFKWTCEMGAKTRLGIDYRVPLEEAYRIVDVYRQKNYKIKQQWDRCQEWLFRMINNDEPFNYSYGDGEFNIVPKENRIYFPNGTYLYYPCLSWDDGSFTYVKKLGKKYVNRYIYGGKMVENIVQKHSRDIVAWQMLNIAERYRLVLHTYDENVALVPFSEREEGTEWVINEMKKSPSWAASLPLNAEGGWAKEYSK
jgi:DNA polymerase